MLAQRGAHPEALARAAARRVRANRLDEALTAYEKAVEAVPDGVTQARLLYEMAWLAREAQSDPRAARAYLDRSLALDTTAESLRLGAALAEQEGRLDELERFYGRLAQAGDRHARLLQARTLLRLGRYTDAIDAAEHAVDDYPREALPVVAEAYRQLGDRARQRATLERLQKGDPAPEALLDLSGLLVEHGDGQADLETARTLLVELVSAPLLPPLVERALVLLCEVLERQDDGAAFERALLRLADLRTDPLFDQLERYRTLCRLGELRVRLGLIADAADAFRRAHELLPEDARAIEGMAATAMRQKRWQDALAPLEQLYERGLPPRVERALQLGEVADQLGLPTAAGYFQAALDAGATAAEALRAWDALARLHRRRQDFPAEIHTLIAAADDRRTDESPVGRAARLVAAGNIHRKILAQPDEARALFERALSFDALHLQALDALEAIAMDAGDSAHLADVLLRKVAATAQRTRDQRAILGRLAELERRMGHAEAAQEAYRRALLLDPDFRAALVYLAEEARGQGDVPTERRHLERLVTLPPDPLDPDGRVEALLRLAMLHLEDNRLVEAEHVAGRARREQPRSMAVLNLLDTIFSRVPRPQRLIDVLAQRIEIEPDPTVVESLLLRRAALFESIGQVAHAVAAYQEITALHPDLTVAWQRLAALLTAQDAVEPLVGVQLRLAERHAAVGRALEAEALFTEAAHLCHDRLHDLTRARAVLARALEVQPRSLLAVSGLLTLARETGDTVEEDALLGRIADLESRPSQRIELTAERARLRYTRGDRAGAESLLAELSPGDLPTGALRMLVEVAEEQNAGEPGRVTPILEELRRRGTEQSDVALEKYAVRRLAKMAALKGPSRAAEELFRRALTLDPDDPLIARALADVERSRGDDLSYLDTLDQLLIGVRRRFEGADREAELCVEMAVVLRRVGDLDSAQTRLREALDAKPDHGPAWRLYGEIAAGGPNTVDALRALERAAELGALDSAGYARLAELHERQGDNERAAQAYERAGEKAPAAQRARLLEKVGRDHEALALWRTVDSVEAKEHIARLAHREAARHRAGGDLPSAWPLLEEALVGRPDDEETLGWLLLDRPPADGLAVVSGLASRLHPADGALLLERAAARWPRSAPEGQAALERSLQLWPRPSVLVTLAQLVDGTKPTLALEHLGHALRLDPGSVDAALAFRTLAPPAEAALALETAWERHTASTSPDNRPLRAQLSAALGALYRDGLGDPVRARDFFRRAVDESQPGEAWRADSLRALAALEQALDRRPAAEEALEFLKRETTASQPDLRHLAELYLDRGAGHEAAELLADVPGSTDLLFRALEAAGRLRELVDRLESEAMRRTDDEARALLIRAAMVAERTGDIERAALLYQSALPLGPADAELWLKLGALQSGPLGRADDAAYSFTRALAADRSRTEVLVPLGDYHFQHDEWSPARDYYNQALQRVALSSDAARRLRLQLAEIARRTNDAAGEVAALEAAHAVGPRLAELYRQTHNPRLGPLLFALAAEVTGHERAALLREALPFADASQVDEVEAQLLEADPADAEVQVRVLRRLRADPERLRAVVARLRHGGVLVHLEPATERALLRAERRHAELLSHYDNALTAGAYASEEERRELELAAVDVLAGPLAQPVEAAFRLRRIFDREHDRRLLPRARQLFVEAKLYDEARSCLAEERARAAPADEISLALDEAELLLLLDRDDQALTILESVLRREPRHGRARLQMGLLYKRHGDAASSLEHLIVAVESPDLAPAQAAEAALTAAELFGTRAEATSVERMLRLALSVDPGNLRALEGLIGVAADKGDAEKQVEPLGRAMQVATERTVRARFALQRAQLYQEALGRDYDAYRAFREAVACDPQLLDAIRPLGEMAEARGEWALAAELRYQEIGATANASAKAKLHEKLARLFDEKLAEAEEAVRNYEQAVQLHGDDAAARGPLAEVVRLHAAQQRFDLAATAAERLAHFSGERSVERADGLLAAGQWWLRAGDEQRARARFDEAVQASPAGAEGTEISRRADEALLQLTARSGDLAELRGKLEERLATAPSGEARRHLLAQLLELAEQLGDVEALDRRSWELLEEAPQDTLAFITQRRLAEQRNDLAGLAHLLRGRAEALAHAGGDVAERASLRFEAGRIAERSDDPAAAAIDYGAALAIDPAHIAALDARADLAYRTGTNAEARSFYAQLSGRSSILSPEELLRRRAQLAVNAGDVAEAEELYRQTLSLHPADRVALEALARLRLSAGDEAGGFGLLAAALETQPLESVNKVQALRLELGRLALRLDQREAALGYYELIVAEAPGHSEALAALERLHLDAEQWSEAAEVYLRRSYLVDEPRERAELLYRRGEALLRQGDHERANDAFLKAIDLHPTHAPTLRRLVRYYFAEGDFEALAEITHELEALGAPLNEVQLWAGLGLALSGDEARGTVLVAVAQPTAEALVDALSDGPYDAPGQLDPVLRLATRALGGGDGGRQALTLALRERLLGDPTHQAARRALGRLHELMGETAQARLHYGVLAFIDESSATARHLDAMAPTGPLAGPLAGPKSAHDVVHPSARGSLREALVLLAPHLFGMPLSALDVDIDGAWTDRLAPVGAAFGLSILPVSIVAGLREPAWAEPTLPPRLILAAHTIDSEGATAFAGLRALAALTAGVPLVEARTADEVVALIAACTALFLPDLRAIQSADPQLLAEAQSELASLPFLPEQLDDERRERLEMALAAALVDQTTVQQARTYPTHERFTANRRALHMTGDLRAALWALAGPEAKELSPLERRQRLAHDPALTDLLRYTLTM